MSIGSDLVNRNPGLFARELHKLTTGVQHLRAVSPTTPTFYINAVDAAARSGGGERSGIAGCLGDSTWLLHRINTMAVNEWRSVSDTTGILMLNSREHAYTSRSIEETMIDEMNMFMSTICP